MVTEQFERKDSYLSRRIRRAAMALCFQVGFRPCDRKDYEQHLKLHVWKRRHAFEPERACFDTFVDRIVTNEVRSMIRNRNRMKRCVVREQHSLNECITGWNREETSRHESVASEFCPRPHDSDFVEDYRTLLSQLDALDHSIHLHRVEGRSKRAIASLLGIPRERVEQALDRIREAAVRLGLDGYLE